MRYQVGPPLRTAGLGDSVDARLSPRTGAGVEGWLDQVLSGNRIAGGRILDVDYRRYAEAEAAFGWLNFQVRIKLRRAFQPRRARRSAARRTRPKLDRGGDLYRSPESVRPDPVGLHQSRYHR